MRGLGGFVLLAGIGVGLFVYFPAPVDRDTSLEQAKLEQAKRTQAARVAASRPRIPRAPTAAPSRVASFSPALTLTQAPSKPHVAVAPAPATPTPAAKVESVANWQTSVMPTAAGPSGSLEPTDPESRYKLVVDIQQQLKRVGCYWGRANGAWNANTREAMRDFTTRANAALPVDKPDYLLLTLLKSHTGRSCGANEPTVAAQPRGKGEDAVAAAPEVLPWKANGAQPATRLYTPLPNSVVSTEPLPGRMAIGAPKEFPPVTQQQPLIPGTTAPGQPGVATAALEPSATSPAAVSPPPAVTPRPQRQVKKKSGSFRRPAPGTPRYNLMLSLGGVY
ncbi:MAG: hypothetical protein K8F92_11870 [Hyphomicrobium sp.]|uniref:peptidoglycan-binding domain-containing protein n=1 Tax=Hyphomicrobium sp. TaxID=82 RepID=UPI001328D6B7|nr:hypothetical protein [Hyphomicrobium sp.]KAB2940552.1 MAG: hypothetical protein F9K20_12960 [Hyphomicrobium sp.]MBZ0210335.1 hypothetical protein [Hyphomicrobium sp.]